MSDGLGGLARLASISDEMGGLSGFGALPVLQNPLLRLLAGPTDQSVLCSAVVELSERPSGKDCTLRYGGELVIASEKR